MDDRSPKKYGEDICRELGLCPKCHAPLHSKDARQAQDVPTNWQEKYNEVKDGLRQAVDLLKKTSCENCGTSLADVPSRSTCGDYAHVTTAHEIMDLEELIK